MSRSGRSAVPLHRGCLATLCVTLCLACGTAPDGPPLQLGVPPGSSLGAIADSLTARGVLTSATWFKLLGRIRGVDRQLKPGIYEFTPGTAANELLDQLAAGRALQFRLTLPEGGTLWDFVRNAERQLGMAPEQVWPVLRDSALRAEFGITAPTVEGWLHPDTYLFGGYDTPRQVVRQFLAARRQRWTPEWQQRAEAAGLERVDVLALASIVEAEAFRNEEMPRIAAVYRNRIRIGMPLQADPTIQYAFLMDRGERVSRMLNRDYAYPSPYNTYLYRGLPPTPIGNPSDAAIEAVLSPAQSRELYFVARGDGSHVFAESYAQHLRNIRMVRSR